MDAVVTERIPKSFVYAIIALCVLPYLLSSLGVDFGSQGQSFDLQEAQSWPDHQVIDAMFYRLSGAFSHTILEWSAFTVALFTVCLSICHYLISKDVTTPVIGAALFLAGCMDAFHTLAADRLIEAVADNRDLIPFTWAICRVFNAAVLIIGVTVLMNRKHTDIKADVRLIAIISVVFAVTAYGIIRYCAINANLPQTQFPDSLITRPYDVVPLLMFAFAGLYLFPRFYQGHPNLFAHALIIAMIPECVVELHMAFGSSALFDSHFNIAHFLKIFAYAVPFFGLLLDYIHTYQIKEKEVIERKKAESALEHHMQELQRSNQELAQFAFIASHDLRSPIQAIEHLTHWIKEDIDNTEIVTSHLDVIQSRISRMRTMLDDLLEFTTTGSTPFNLATIDSGALAQEFYKAVNPPADFTLSMQGNWPNFTTYEEPFCKVLRDLIDNAVKHHNRRDGKITLTASEHEKDYCFEILDDGPGIAPKYHSRVFKSFQTLKSRDDVEGSGVGLAMAKKILHLQGGTITLKSQEQKGTSVSFTWPKSNPLPDGQ
mgnify:CR=1 FL=1